MRHAAPNRPWKEPKQGRSRATVEAILEASARVPVREGHAKRTTIGVAEVAGYGLGPIYNYVPDKESLVAVLVERHAEKMVAVVESRRLGRCASVFSSGPVVLTAGCIDTDPSAL